MINQLKLRTNLNTLRRYNNSTLSHNDCNRNKIDSDDDNSPTIYQPTKNDETIISDNNMNTNP